MTTTSVPSAHVRGGITRRTHRRWPVIALVAVAAGLVGLAVVLLRRRSLPAG